MIKIDFEQSHLLFPKIMIIITLLLFIAIIIKFLPDKIREYKNGKRISFFVKDYDKLRFYGFLILIAVYFKCMEFVGSLFPNMGYGFLFTSMIFIFAISLLFTGKPTKKKLIVLSINSLITPIITWFIFNYLFNITLP